MHLCHVIGYSYPVVFHSFHHFFGYSPPVDILIHHLEKLVYMLIPLSPKLLNGMYVV